MTTRRSSNAERLTLAVDKTVALTINGSTQKVRMTSSRPGLPPLLVVQAGPGLPMLHEVSKFQQRLQFETDFLVFYWEQRGTGRSPRADARGVSLRQQVDDLYAVLKWVHDQTRQPVLLFGISIGGTLALRVAERAPELVTS